jgi:uncharacterized glyoxalase superfamily protein PhnB
MSQTPKLFPFLRYDEAPAALEFLCAAFGFEKRFVAPGRVPGTIDNAQLGLGPELIMIATARQGPRQGIYVFVPNVEAHYAQARAAKAEITQPLYRTDYGSTEYSALDCEGHAWSFGSYRGHKGDAS